MEDKDSQRPGEDQPREDDNATRPVSPEDRSTEASRSTAEATPREDDRNQELEQSPVPDPEAKDTGAEDDPQAD